MQTDLSIPHSVLLIDDEPAARQLLKGLIGLYCPQLKVIGEASGVKEGVAAIQKMKPALIFLDVEMGDGQGFDLLDHFDAPSFKVIFTTAHQKFAVRAFKYYALGYLLKPIDPDDLTTTVQHILQKDTMPNLTELIQSLRQPAPEPTSDRIALPSFDGLTMMKIDSIIRLESDQGYTTFYSTEGEKVLVTRSIGEFENTLPRETFYRVHVSHLINLDFVKKFIREDGGYVIMENGDQVPIARRRKEEFLEVLKGRSVF